MSKRYLVYADFHRFNQDIPKNGDIPSKIEKLAKELEEGRFCKFEKMGAESFYKFRTGDHRIIAHKYVPADQDQDVEVYVLLVCFPRRSNEYINTPRRKQKQTKRLEEFNSNPYHTQFQQWLTEQLKEPPKVIPSPDENELLVLNQCRQSDTKTNWILETPTWIEKVNTRTFKGLFFPIKESIEELLVEAVDQETPSVQIWESEQVKIIYYFTNEGAYEGRLFLLDIFLEKEPETTLREVTAEFTRKINTATNLDAIARRAYPEYILNNFQLWVDIQEDVQANLALSPEERRILEGVLAVGQTGKRYPLFINGRPGSGKSTILQYLYAEYFKSALAQNRPLPLLLTYSEPLCKSARESVTTLIERNAELLQDRLSTEQDFKKEIEETLQQSICSYRDFLKGLLPKSVQQKLHASKYVGYTQFKKWLEPRLRGQKLKDLTVELCWHVIRTYIKGMGGSTGDFDPIDYQTYPEKRRTVSDLVFVQVYDKVWENYKEYLREHQLWDDQDLTALVLELDKESLPKVPAVFCDEAQDFTKQELEFLFQLSTFSQRSLHQYQLSQVPFIFAGDPFQTLNPTGFNWDMVKADFYEQIRDGLTRGNEGLNLDFNFQELQYNYRSSQRIVQFCNAIQLRRGLTLHKKDLIPQEVYFHEQSPVPTYFDIAAATVPMQDRKNQGINILLPCPEGAEKEFWKNDSDLIELIGDLEEGAGKPVFSPMSAKGLEFPRIVLYKFGAHILDNPSLQETLLNASYNHSPESLLPASYFFNSLYVAASRAKKRVLIVDTQDALQQFWKPLFADKEALQTSLEQYKQFTKNDTITWDATQHLSIIEHGKKEDWYQDVEDLERMAKQYFDNALLNADPELMEKAERTYRHLRLSFQQKIAGGYRHYFSDPPRYKEAGRLFKNGRNEEKTKAVECFWKAKEFQQILEVDPDVAEKRVEYELARFVETQNTLSDTLDLLERIQHLLSTEDDTFTLCIQEKEPWAEVVKKLKQNIDDHFNDNNISDEIWEELKTSIDACIAAGLFSYSPSFLKPHYRRHDFDAISRHWESVPNKPMPENYPEWLHIVFSETSSYPKRLEHLFPLQRFKTIREEFLSYEDAHIDTTNAIPLTGKQGIIVTSAFLKESNIEQSFQILKKYNSVDLATFILRQEMYADHNNTELATVAAQRLFEAYIRSGQYKKAHKLLFRGKQNPCNDGFDVYNRHTLQKFALRYLAFIKQKEMSNNDKKTLEEMWNKLRRTKGLASHLLRGLAYEKILPLYPLDTLEKAIQFYEKEVNNGPNAKEYLSYMERCAYITNLQLKHAEQGMTEDYKEQLKRRLPSYLQKINKTEGDIEQLSELYYQNTVEFEHAGTLSRYLLYSIDYNKFQGWNPSRVTQPKAPITKQTTIPIQKKASDKKDVPFKHNPKISLSDTVDKIPVVEAKGADLLDTLGISTIPKAVATTETIETKQAINVVVQNGPDKEQETDNTPQPLPVCTDTGDNYTATHNTSDDRQPHTADKVDTQPTTVEKDTTKPVEKNKNKLLRRPVIAPPPPKSPEIHQLFGPSPYTVLLSGPSAPRKRLSDDTFKSVSKATKVSKNTQVTMAIDNLADQTHASESLALNNQHATVENIIHSVSTSTRDTHNTTESLLDSEVNEVDGEISEITTNKVDDTSNTQTNVDLVNAQTPTEEGTGTQDLTISTSSEGTEEDTTIDAPIVEVIQEQSSTVLNPSVETTEQDLAKPVLPPTDSLDSHASVVEVPNVDAGTDLSSTEMPILTQYLDDQLQHQQTLLHDLLDMKMTSVLANVDEKLNTLQQTISPQTENVITLQTDLLANLQSHLNTWQETLLQQITTLVQNNHIENQGNVQTIVSENTPSNSTPAESTHLPACRISLFDNNDQLALTIANKDFMFSLIGSDTKRALTITLVDTEPETVKFYLTPSVPGTVRSMDWDIVCLDNGTYWIDTWQIGIRRAVHGELVIVEIYNSPHPEHPAIFSFAV